MEKLYGSIYSTYTPLRIELVRFYQLLKEKKVDIASKIVQKLAKLGIMDSVQVGSYYVTHTNIDCCTCDSSFLYVLASSSFRIES